MKQPGEVTSIDSNKPTYKKILKGVLITLLIIIMIISGYLVYAFVATTRIEDKLDLEVSDKTASMLQAGNEYSISTFNVGYGGIPQDFSFFMEGGDDVNVDDIGIIEDDTEGIIEMLGTPAPDFMLFQEVDLDSTRSYHYNQYERFSKEYPLYDSTFAINYHSAYLIYPFDEPIGKSKSGIATFSKYNIVSGLRRKLETSGGFSRLVDLDRCYSVNEIPVSNGKTLYLYNVHLTAYAGSVEISDSQVKMLAADMKEKYDAGNYVICGGDFNHDFTGDSIKRLNEEYTEQDWTKPIQKEFFDSYFTLCTKYDTELCATSRSLDGPYVKGKTDVFIIDGFIISDNIKCNYQKVIPGEFKYSDHNPVYMQFTLEK